MKDIYQKYYTSLEHTNIDFKRYLYNEINWDSRMIGIVGARGVGKTMMILQYIKETLDVKQDIASSEKADFSIEKYTFEIGGKNKKQQQIKDIENAFVVKDDIEYGYLNIVPLWAFGFNY